MNQREQPTPERSLTPEELESFQGYLRDLHLSPEDLEGKKILDVGAAFGRFARACEKQGIDADITSLDPRNLSKERGAEPQSKAEERYVAGKGEELPFKSGSFDLVISWGAVPLEVTPATPENTLRAINEMLRVANPEGEVRFSPASTNKVNPETGEVEPWGDTQVGRELEEDNRRIKQALKLLEDSGSNIELKTSREQYRETGKDFLEMTVAIIRRRSKS